MVTSLNEYCKQHNMFNYAKLKGRFSNKAIFIAIQDKQQARKISSPYKDKYKWLTLYDEEVDFLLQLVAAVTEKLKEKKR